MTELAKEFHVYYSDTVGTAIDEVEISGYAHGYTEAAAVIRLSKIFGNFWKSREFPCRFISVKIRETPSHRVYEKIFQVLTPKGRLMKQPTEFKLKNRREV